MMINLSLKGNKTYLTAIGIIAAAAYTWYTGDADLGTAVHQALVGLGLAALRNGVSNLQTGGDSASSIQKP